MSETSYHIPEDRFYDKEHHMWAKLEDGLVVVGMDTLGLASLGDLAYVSFEGEGHQVKAGESLGVVEAAKMTGDIVAPVSGKVVKRNQDAVRNPALVNNDPYGSGWLVAIEPDDWDGDSAALVSGNDLPTWVAAETERYRAQGWIN